MDTPFPTGFESGHEKRYLSVSVYLRWLPLWCQNYSSVSKQSYFRLKLVYQRDSLLSKIFGKKKKSEGHIFAYFLTAYRAPYIIKDFSKMSWRQEGKTNRVIFTSVLETPVLMLIGEHY